MSNIIFFEKNVIDINGHKKVFQHDISEVKEIGDLVAVRLSIPTNQSLDLEDFSNVYCINNSGIVTWQIKNNKPVDNPDFILAPISLLVLIDEKLVVTDFMGRRYSVNLSNGEMELIGISK